MDNAFRLLNEYFSFDDLMAMPLRDLIDYIEYFSPKMKRIAEEREERRVKAELENKRRQKEQELRNRRRSGAGRSR